MYEELVKLLRNCSGTANPCPCNGCAMYEDNACSDTLMRMAADAIEDLEFACNRYEKDYKDHCDYLPKWIPVTERPAPISLALETPPEAVKTAFEETEFGQLTFF